MAQPKRLTARYVVRESDLIGMKWDERQNIIEEAQRYVQAAIGHQIVRAILDKGDSAHVSIQYSITEEKGGTEVVTTYQATVD